MHHPLHTTSLLLALCLPQTHTTNDPILNVTRAFWITVHPEKSPPINLWPGILPEKYLGLRGDDSLMQFLTPRAKHSILHRRCDGKDLPSTNAAALYINHVDIWKLIKPGEVIAVFEEDATITLETPKIIQELDQTRRQYGKESFFYDDKFYLSLYLSHAQTFHCKRNTQKRKEPDFEDQYIEDASCSIGYGTSSYLIGYSVAQELIKNAFPIDIQIDAYIALEAMFMYETRPDLRFAKTKNELYTQHDNLLNKILEGSQVQNLDFVDFYKDPQFTLSFTLVISLQFFILGVICGRCMQKNRRLPPCDMSPLLSRPAQGEPDAFEIEKKGTHPN